MRHVSRMTTSTMKNELAHNKHPCHQGEAMSAGKGITSRVFAGPECQWVSVADCNLRTESLIVYNIPLTVTFPIATRRHLTKYI